MEKQNCFIYVHYSSYFGISLIKFVLRFNFIKALNYPIILGIYLI